MEPLQLYYESHNIFLKALSARNGGSHVGYLETHLQDAGPSFFFIRSFEDWREELQKQSQGLGHSSVKLCCRLQMLERKEKLNLSHTYSICTKYLVEVFKCPGTGKHIPSDSDDGYGMTQMIGLYGLVKPYSIIRITTTQFRVVKDGKKSSRRSVIAWCVSMSCKTICP